LRYYADGAVNRPTVDDDRLLEPLGQAPEDVGQVLLLVGRRDDDADPNVPWRTRIGTETAPSAARRLMQGRAAQLSASSNRRRCRIGNVDGPIGAGAREGALRKPIAGKNRLPARHVDAGL
jgi:hypothetical protein